MFVLNFLSGHDDPGTRTLEMSISRLQMNEVNGAKQGEKTEQY